MPFHFDSATCCGDLFCMESDGFLAITPTRIGLTELDCEVSRATLQEHTDLAAVIILEPNDWFAETFAETWNVLPNRLASLAVRPPSTASLVARSGDSMTRAQRFVGDTPRFSLWRSLVELAKSGANIAIQWASKRDVAVSSPANYDEDGLPELLSSPPRRELDWLFGELKLARLSDLCGDVVSSADATAVLAGLWLLHGDSEASHQHSQSIEDEGRHRCGNFWHAIMHRQEPDYGNSKYWFRRVGQHPIFAELARRADELIAADGSDAALRWRSKLGAPVGWDSFAFVDWCEAAAGETDKSQIGLVRRLQFLEMHLLLRASYADATRP